ncbi:MAG TPA: DUF2062 domain-containing protein [Gallionella sp.]|nr:DUF2062 domain-containing protein [Gallionella sp.]
MRNYLRKLLPSLDTVKNQRWLKPFGNRLHHPNLWHLHRRSVAGGVAIGLFCGLIPGPLQMISAALFAVLLRANLPVAVFATLYTNPLTIIPLYLVAYEFGAWVSGKNGDVAPAKLTLPELHWHNWFNELWNWLLLLGEPIFIGLPLLAMCLAIIGYFAVRVAWRVSVTLKWRARRKRRKAGERKAVL